jgi:hypothetical protein
MKHADYSRWTVIEQAHQTSLAELRASLDADKILFFMAAANRHFDLTAIKDCFPPSVTCPTIEIVYT